MSSVGRSTFDVHRGAPRSLVPVYLYTCTHTPSALCGVSQGSILGLLMYIAYTFDLIQLTEWHGTTLCMSLTLKSAAHVVLPTSACIRRRSQIAWGTLDEVEQVSLKLIKDWGHYGVQQACIGTVSRRLWIGPATSVHEFGIYIDADLKMRTHVQRTVSWCFAVLRQLRQIREPRMICQLRRSEHPTTSLTRLPAYTGCAYTERIHFKIVVLAYKVLHGTAPRYLGPLVRVSDWLGRRCLRSTSTDRLVVPSIGRRTFKGCCCSDLERSAGGRNIVTNVTHFRKRLKTLLLCHLILTLFLNLTCYIYPHSCFEVALLPRPLNKFWLIGFGYALIGEWW